MRLKIIEAGGKAGKPSLIDVTVNEGSLGSNLRIIASFKILDGIDILDSMGAGGNNAWGCDST